MKLKGFLNNLFKNDGFILNMSQSSDEDPFAKYQIAKARPSGVPIGGYPGEVEDTAEGKQYVVAGPRADQKPIEQ